MIGQNWQEGSESREDEQGRESLELNRKSNLDSQSNTGELKG